MIWWFRSHRAALQLALCVTAAAAAPVLGSAGILLPSLGSSGLFASAPLAVIVAMLVGLCAAANTARNDTAEWRTAARDLRVLAVTQSAAPFVLLAAGATIWVLAQAPSAARLGIAAVGIYGLQQIGHALFGVRFEAAVPVLYVFITALFGRVLGHGGIAFWAWPIEASPGRTTWAVVIATLCVGGLANLCSLLLRRPLLVRSAQMQARTS